MTKEEFENEINRLIETPDPEATKAWLGYSDYLEQDQICDAADFRRVVHKELVAIKKKYGPTIAERLYNAATEFTFNPFEMRQAAKFLNDGKPTKEVIELAQQGLCEGDGPVPKPAKKQRDRNQAR